MLYYETMSVERNNVRRTRTKYGPMNHFRDTRSGTNVQVCGIRLAIILLNAYIRWLQPVDQWRDDPSNGLHRTRGKQTILIRVLIVTRTRYYGAPVYWVYVSTVTF
jgi:hypothetical protein